MNAIETALEYDLSKIAKFIGCDPEDLCALLDFIEAWRMVFY